MFGHPYTPYDVQKQFMSDLYEFLNQDDRKVAIFESPTGTGKTLSILCATLAFTKDASKRRLEKDLANIESSKGPLWTIKRAKELRIQQYEDEKDDKDVGIGSRGNEDTDSNKRPRKYMKFIPRQRILFASRTHSQLAQVADALVEIEKSTGSKIAFTPLGSRKHMCIKPEVRNSPTQSEVNDRCLEFQQDGRCTYRTRSGELEDVILSKVMDIEDLVKVGKDMCACPYYAARQAASFSDVIAMPYPLLLVSNTRNALNISLKDTIVVIDEAHNLIPTISSLHSAELSEVNVIDVIRAIKGYLSKLGDKLNFNNKRRINQLLVLSESIMSFLNREETRSAKKGSEFQVHEMLRERNADTLNIIELNKFASETKLVFKVDTYADPPVQRKLGLSQLINFVLTATDPLSEGKLFIDRDESGSTVLKRLTLDPSEPFKNIVDTCDSVVLAGGTMEPVMEFEQQLKLKENLLVHSYEHVIPKSQLLVIPESDLEFTFARRSQREVITALGEIVLRYAEHIPKGIVLFFPGYGYLNEVVDLWKKSGIWKKLADRKDLFVESTSDKQKEPSRNQNSYKTNDIKNKSKKEIDQHSDIFLRYSMKVKKANGAMLFAVVGGKLSEGINFSDDLARAVIMVGLPFPNAFSAEMLAKKSYIEKIAKDEGYTLNDAKQKAITFYENIAMRAVNQSIGRAIRHSKDYAAIVLIDKRYKQERIQSKLSKWIRDRISSQIQEESVKEHLSELDTFFTVNSTSFPNL